jgi:hypothetical protein
MRLLSELYRVSSDVDLRVDIAQRLLGRTLDLDASVRVSRRYNQYKRFIKMIL